MRRAEYSEPVQRLVSLGYPEQSTWQATSASGEYAAAGIGVEHVPELVRLACDASRHQGGEPECWGPLHAWRALGELKAVQAVEPLVGLMDKLATWDDDWGLEEVPSVLLAVGPGAIPAMARALRDQRVQLWARVGMAEALGKMSKLHEDQRPGIAAILLDQLGRARYNDPMLNAFVIAGLLKVRAVEALPAIERVYRQGLVDEQAVGNYSEVEEEMRMTPEEHAAHQARIAAENEEFLRELDKTEAKETEEQTAGDRGESGGALDAFELTREPPPLTALIAASDAATSGAAVPPGEGCHSPAPSPGGS